MTNRLLRYGIWRPVTLIGLLAGAVLLTSNRRPEAPRPDFPDRKISTERVESIVRAGYRSLAQRTLEHYNRLKSRLSSDLPRDLQTLDQFVDNLHHLSETGDIGSLENGKTNFQHTASMFEQAIPYRYKANSLNLALGLAMSSLMEYFDISTPQELLKKAKIDDIQRDSDYGNVVTLPQKDGPTLRVLNAYFHPNRGAHATIVNIHIIYKCLQPEFQEPLDVLKELEDIPGYDGLHQITQGQDASIDSAIDYATNSHILHFLNLSKSKKAAQESGVNMDRLNAYLSRNIPRLDFLTCYSEGDAYLMQRDIIAVNPILRRDQAIIQGYQLLALVDALSSASLGPRLKYNRLGIGLAEYFRNHPAEKEKLKNSSEFHQEVSAYLQAK